MEDYEIIGIDAKLALDRFDVDESNAHIVLKDITEAELPEYRELMLACPAGLYKLAEDGTARFDYAGCLECGTCRILCGGTILEKWEFPQAACGIGYRFG